MEWKAAALRLQLESKFVDVELVPVGLLEADASPCCCML